MLDEEETHNEYELHKEADEAHHHESECSLRAYLIEFCKRRNSDFDSNGQYSVICEN